jgi:hypothetical protein
MLLPLQQLLCQQQALLGALQHSFCHHYHQQHALGLSAVPHHVQQQQQQQQQQRLRLLQALHLHWWQQCL